MRPFTFPCALVRRGPRRSGPRHCPVSADRRGEIAPPRSGARAAPPAPPANPPVVLQAPGAPVAPTIAAASWVLVDTLSGQTLGAANADERRDPASLTKLMTAYVAFAALRAKTIMPSQMVTVSQRAWKAEGSRMFIEPRKAVSVDELLHGVIIQSGNDASIAVAELVAGTRGGVRRPDEPGGARGSGMTSTHFANATGLPDPQHYSTAARHGAARPSR